MQYHEKSIRHGGLAAALLLAIAACGEAPSEPAGAEAAWQATDDGLVVVPAGGDFRRVRLQVYDDRIVRVTATPHEGFADLGDTMMIVAEPRRGAARAEERGDTVVLDAGAVTAEVVLADGTVRFRDAEGRLLLAEAARHAAPVTLDPGAVDANAFAPRQEFEQSGDEAWYGLGQQQDGRVNYAGENVELTTHNIEIAIPYLASTVGYGILWNNASITRIGDPEPPPPLAEAFDLYDAAGNPGGLTARYYGGEELLLERVEADLGYPFLAHGSTRERPFPEEVREVNDLRIEWAGSIVPRTGGVHELKMYSSGYASLALDGDTLLERWRMNWNPWFHNAKAELEAGRRYPIAVDWTAQGGYFRLLQHAPAPAARSGNLAIASETGKAVDYFFVAGETLDELVSGYRRLTGKATLLPRWAFGFWQSRERYTSQDELVGVLEAYRQRRIPIDNIVLDWFYWPEDAWGSHDFDPNHFPDPQAMVERVHELEARIMISVWPKFYPATAQYRALAEQDCIFEKNIEMENYDWVGPGYLNGFYDAFDPDCRELYWAQLRDKLDGYGFDAWWLDAVEPDMHSNLSIERRKDLMTPNALGTGAEYFNAYALPHAEAVYRGTRESDPERRRFILTRSGFGGIQRTGSAIWSGDVVSRWSNLREQIAAGIGVGLAGMPWWTHDIGGFTPEDQYRYHADGTVGHYAQMPAEHRDEWQELNLRWFQFGAFTPIFRSHGQNPYREVFNLADEGSEVYASLVHYLKLRYRLMPYIYTLAGDAWQKDGTMMRGLAMDFPHDAEARDVATQYMFGPAFLVNPVYEHGARSRRVYLPDGGAWYDFDSGARHEGGQWITADAPLARLPLFVRAGAIVPTGPAIQHTGEGAGGPLLLNVYTGADGAFDIYDDDGLTYGYENGQWMRIPVRYRDATGTLTIGEREGGFAGMAAERGIAVRFIDGTGARPADFDAEPDARVAYTGAAVTVSRPAD